MGRLTTTAAVATAAALGLPAAAPAVSVQDFSVRIDSRSTNVKAGTSKNPRPHALRIQTGTRETTPGVQPPTTRRATIYFPRGARYNGQWFRGCASSRINAAKSTDACASATRIGRGRAAGLAPGPITQNDLRIDAMNGVNGRYVNLFVEGTSPLRIQSNIVARVSRAGGNFSYKLDVPIPQNLQEPAPGVPVAITNFEVNVNRKTTRRAGKLRGYVESTACPANRRWTFRGVFEYTNGERATVTDTVRCRR